MNILNTRDEFIDYIPAKKSLGQNFLRSESAIKEIVSSAKIKEGDLVLEIGPGKGALTEKLLLAGARVLAIEKDSRLIEELKEKFSAFADKFYLIEGDILDFEPRVTIKEPYKLVANIPYYLTGLIIRKFLENEHSPEIAVLLVQKEVASRICNSKKENLLSISVKVYGEPSLVKTVKAGSFIPSPKVDSAIIKIENISKIKFQEKEIDEKIFFKFVKSGFAHNRKKLSSNLKDLVEKTELEKFLVKQKLSPSARAEDLSISEWIELVSRFK
jgi:16S rRNA (adenine1518-N6/adenine1519-N6)-dimethyltransferase